MADCDSIVRDVARLLTLVDTLVEAEIDADSQPERQLLQSQLNHARTQLQHRRHDLDACRSVVNALRDPRVLGFEVNQGLSGYELVAGKDTLFRVFLGVPDDVLAPPEVTAGMPMMITNTPVFHFSRLDFASLSITGPDGVTFQVHGDLGNGQITNYSRNYDEHHNANFYVDGASLDKPGDYRAVARFYREDSLVGQVVFGRHTFHRTKDLRLLIVVDTWPMPVAAWNSLFRSLEHVQRAFPVRAGIGPLNGDLRAGLRYEIDPNPFDPDWPAWDPVRQRFADFNAAQQAQGHPDRIEHIQTVRVQQPGEQPLGGVGEQGPGKAVSGVTLNVHPPMDGVFATLMSQEIGHNFGLRHTMPEAEIQDTSAFDLLDRRGVARPRSIMFGGYSDTPSEDGFFLPDDWKMVRQGLTASGSTGNG
jgi:hypothetical protein